MSVSVTFRDDEDTIEITLSTVPFSSNKIARWGWMSTSDLLVEAQIVVLQGSAEFASGSTITADFRAGNAAPMFLYMAERDTEPIKTVWYGSGLNQGLIGPGQAFQVIGVVNGWRVYRSNFKTQFSTTTEFRIS
ncbi:hypothetical protein LZD49_12415 [Dyadobacter sp. CY261]|uniref:hypothetical protein n=1 Tax=Dyadobacter sp. CY261 TaxID=2907203 RepID=UPI001F43B233|nr:hypothetical protein [Dyadobacter sp. CY261]MCF0071276.1 hypothetical protein [Dyadobacter sp. CY261]